MNNLMVKTMINFNKVFNNQKGQSMVEYALILALIVVAAAAIMSPIGNSIRDAFSSIASSFGGGAAAS